MRKIVIKILIILVIFQMFNCINNINIVNASTADNMFSSVEQQSQTFQQMGSDKVSSLGISISNMTTPVGVALGLVHFLAIAATTIKLLITLFRILKEDTLDKAKAKKSITFDLILLFLAVAGIPWAKKIITMLA